MSIRPRLLAGLLVVRPTPAPPRWPRFPSSRLYATGGLNSKDRPGWLVKVKEGALHYWHGSKLLAYETRISCKLLKKLLRGEKLIRREYRQLLRTTSDLFRLIPFIIIAIVPFLEFALPVLIKLFPNLLPSTFEDRHQAEAKVERQLKIKLEMAKFLQNIAGNMSARMPRQNVEKLKTLFEKTRNSGANLTAGEVMEVCRHLTDEVTLENLDRAQLVSLCRYMSLNTFGTEHFLRYQVRRAIARLRIDDEMIYTEGIESLSPEELRAACHSRGIRTIGVPEEYMRRELLQWLELQLIHSVPAPLLILSRAFAMSESVNFETALKAAVTTLPEPVLLEAQVDPSNSGPDVMKDAESRLKMLEQQERLIADELERERAAAKDAAALEAERLSPEDLAAISEAARSLAASDPSVRVKEEFADLVEEHKATSESARKTDDRTVQKIEDQVERLIDDIDEDITDYELEVKRRLSMIDSDYRCAVSTSVLERLVKYSAHTPQDSNRIAAAIKSFDSDGDGKVFVQDIVDIANSYKGTEETDTASSGREGLNKDPAAKSPQESS